MKTKEEIVLNRINLTDSIPGGAKDWVECDVSCVYELMEDYASEKDKRIEALENAGKLFLAALAVSPKDWLCTLELIEAANVMDKTLAASALEKGENK